MQRVTRDTRVHGWPPSTVDGGGAACARGPEETYGGTSTAARGITGHPQGYHDPVTAPGVSSFATPRVRGLPQVMVYFVPALGPLVRVR